jgi:hypothetical protein
MINRLFAALCSWLITCFTLIRFLNIFRQLNTIRSNIILVTCLTIIFSIANSYLIVTLGYDRGQKSLLNENISINSTDYSINSASCHIRDEYENNQITLLLNTLVAGFLNLVLPSMLTLIVNITIVCYIKRIYKAQNLEPIHRRSENVGTNYRSTRSTLLVISITYTLCYLPYCIISLLLIPFADTNTTLFYWSEITFILRYISHSVNFYAYIFTNQRFRRDIVVLLRNIFRPYLCIRKRKERKQKKERKAVIFHHYGLTPLVPANNSAAKMICNYQRPTCIRFQNQNHSAQQQQNLQTNETYFNKHKTVLAMVATPTTSTDRFLTRSRV